jgi:hypothetical protein
VAINGQLDNTKINGDFRPNVVAGAGLRSVPVNGQLYAFDRKDGSLKWYNPVENEHLVLAHFEDLPLLFFTASYQKWTGAVGGFRNVIPVTTAQAIAKHNGKLWYKEDNVPANMNFHDVQMDHRTGKVVVTGYQMRINMFAVPK